MSDTVTEESAAAIDELDDKPGVDSDADATPIDDPAPKAKKPKKSRTPQWVLFAIVAALSLVADQGSKIWARTSLPTEGHATIPGHCIVPDDIVTHMCQGKPVAVIDGFWDWQLSMNPGSAFGFLSGQDIARVLLSIIGIAAVGGMLWMLRKARPDQKVLHWALALVAGGAVGNLVDRIYYGVVTDFVSWHVDGHVWPTFNVADVVLVIGVGLMFIDIQREGKREKRKRAKRAAKAKKAGLVADLSTDKAAATAAAE